MVVNNETVLFLALLLLNWMLVYRKNKFVGNIIFMSLALGTFLLVDLAGMEWISLFFLFVFLISFLYDSFGRGIKGVGK